MRIVVKWLLWIGVLCTSWNVWSQEVHAFQYLSNQDGLSQMSVFAIAQDQAGFMWFGTKNGLNRFDGYEFKVYRKDSSSTSLPADDIRNLYADPEGNKLWIGTNYGVGKYDLDKDTLSKYLNVPIDPTSISSDVIRRVFRDSKGRLWVGTSRGVNLYNEAQDNFQRYLLTHSDVESGTRIEVWTIYQDTNGKLWFGTSEGLFKLIEKPGIDFTFQRIDGENGVPINGKYIRSIVEDNQGGFWIGMDHEGLNYWDRNNNEVTVYKANPNNPGALSDNNIRAMRIDSLNNLWVGTFNGLNFLSSGESTFRVYKKDKLNNAGISDNSIHSLFLDLRGSLWVGTFYGGINHLDENYNRFTNFSFVPFKNSLSADVVSSFAEDQDGNLWIGTEGGGLNFYDRAKNTFAAYQSPPGMKPTIKSSNIKKLLLDENKLWIGTFQGGLNMLDLQDNSIQLFQNDPNNSNSLSGNNIYGIHIEKDKVWVLTYGKGLNIIDQKQNKFYRYRKKLTDGSSICSDLVRTILKTRDQQIWIGTEKGLNKVTLDTTGLPERFELFLEEERIYVLQESWENKIWIGTFSNGLFYLDPVTGVIEHFTTTDGLPGNSIFGVIELSNRELWLSTNKGLSKFNYTDKSFTNYDYSNGLANLEYNFNAYYKTRSGELLFGGINGFTLFNPQDIRPNRYVPPVVLTSLHKNDEVIDIVGENYVKLKKQGVKTIKFNYKEANFSIKFSALDYVSPENNRYAFKLEGLDRDWNYTVGESEATYTIQRDGDYLFKLMGANSDGVWNPEEQYLKIVVLPPPWRTWWAYLTYVLMLGMLSYGLIRYIRLRHKLQLQQVAKQQQEELHEVKLQFFTNITHEFRTPLTLILGPLKELINKEKHSEQVARKLKSIHQNTERLLNLVNQVLTFRKLATEHEPMKLENGNLVDFLQEIFLPFKEMAELRDIHYEFKPEKAVIPAWYDADKLEKVFFNLLANAFKFTPDGGSIAMSVSEKEQYLEIKVSDNGVGIEPELHEQIFKRFYEKSTANRSNIKGTGIGLAISKQMVALHQGKIFVEKNVQDPTFKQGATFVVQIPLDQKPLKQEKAKPIVPEEDQLLSYKPLTVVPDRLKKNAVASTAKEKQQKDLLLIVEDNPEICAYIRQIFEGAYQIITAENGQEGLEMAKAHLPKLIISDVMMPIMDGITFCRQLKTDLEISHIPIILLTARTASILKIEGLKTGADDYVTKPFDPEELELRVRNIIQARQELKNKFHRILSFDPKEINITSADEQFLENAMSIAENNIENYEFNVLQFAQELAVSRPLLFTKLKALTGQTPNNFIKTIRLKRAAQLLKTQKLNVSEVAYKVGFKDPKYFRKCFKEQFNALPSEYGKNLSV